MRFSRIILTFLIVLVAMKGFGQKSRLDSCYFVTDTLTGKQVYRFTSVPASVAGNKDSVVIKILKRLKVNKPDGTESSIAVAFVIDEKGKVSGKRIIRGEVLAKQILDMIDDFEWRPAICEGVPVAAIYFLPLSIHFSGD